MGSPWKMPTSDQCQELVDNTTLEWTSINGVNGMKFTSKIDSTKYIFFSTAGHWADMTHSNSLPGGYWTVIRYTSDYARFLLIRSDISAGQPATSAYPFYVGLSVRANI